MSDPLNILEARNQLSHLVARAAGGEEIVIAKRGNPVAKLVPFRQTSTHSGAALAEWLTHNPPPVNSQRTSTEIDAQIAAERDSWE